MLQVFNAMAAIYADTVEYNSSHILQEERPMISAQASLDPPLG